jgi:hypothetical protein
MFYCSSLIVSFLSYTVFFSQCFLAILGFGICMNVSLLHSLYTRPARPTSSGYVRYTPMLYVRYTFVIFFSINFV